MPVVDITQIKVPGAYVSEQQTGYIPRGIASHYDVFMLGFSNLAGSPKDTPIFCQSLEDFTNVFGATQSTAAVDLFFKQRPGNGLWFVAVSPRATRTVSVTAAPGVGQVYSVTVDGFAISVTAVAADTQSTLMASLSTKLNQMIGFNATLKSGTLRYKIGLTVTVSSNMTLGSEVVAAVYPTVGDVADTIGRAFDTTLPQGFLIAPEFFQSFSQQVDRTALALSMEAQCSDPRYCWMALADVGPVTAVSTSGGGAVQLALIERQALNSPNGHLALYFPYVTNLNDAVVPASPVVAGIALRRYRLEGFRQPPAGRSVPVYGVKSLTFQTTDNVQQQLNPAGVNCLRVLPNKGLLVYGARTCSDSASYQFITTRVIFNVLDRTLATALDELVFLSVDGQGAVFARIKGTAAAICERLRVAGALYGGTPDDAYSVVCDNRNNPTLDLDNGRVALDVYAKPSPNIEILLARVYRVPLGFSLNEESNQSVGR